jgi:two-component system response regulator YesN
MPRVFLVDDEQPVLDGLSVAIRKNMPELEICGSARSGREAIESIGRLKPDLVLMDVRMPGINGLDALREIKRDHPEVVSILLTAYERFDIAKEAFGLGVFDYLVKPVNQEKLIGVIRDALREIAGRKDRNAEAFAYKDEMERVRPLLEDAFALAAIHSGGERAARYLGPLGMDRPYMVAVAIRPPSGGDAESQVRRGLAYRLECLIGPPQCGDVPVFIPLKREEEAQDRLMAVGRFLESAEGGMLAGASAAHAAGDARLAWEEACRALRRATPGALALLPEGSEAPADAASSAAKALREALSCANHRECADAFRSWFSLERARPESRLPGLKLRCSALLAWAAASSGGEGAADLPPDCAGLDAAGDQESLAEACLVRLGQMAERVRNRCGSGKSPQVEKALRHIEENFSKQISLEETADAVRANPAYLSRIFAEEMGQSFVDYLTALRIDFAKRELGRGERTIKEIAVASGYADPNYFSRIFKKITGFTPSEYAQRSGRLLT